ncbi:MAG TPA: HD domain-containing protein [Thermoleophilaceae bacterium]|jgi:(p)ppGpp synthase/HD superfamily hydrolase
MSPSEPGFGRDLPITQAAIDFARDRHSGQRRLSDTASFVSHPLEVGALLDRFDYPDHVIAAAVLHDVLENTETRPGELTDLFGVDVCRLVALVSDDPAIADDDERKDELLERVRQAGGYALVIYAADKVSKVRELQILAARGNAEVDADAKLRRHRNSLVMLEETIPENEVVHLLRRELKAFESAQARRSTASRRSA